MKHGIVPRDLWLEPRFKRLSPRAKLIFLNLLTSPYGNSAQLYRVGPEEIGLARVGSRRTIQNLISFG